MPEYILKSSSAVGVITVGLYYTDREPETYGTGWFGDNNINVGIATIAGLTSAYYISTGRVGVPGNHLNLPASSNITIDVSKNMVAIGTIGAEPIWNFTNVYSEFSRLATVTILATSSSPISMGRTYKINGGSNKAITWATTSVPNFDATNWNILTFRILNDDVGITSVFASKG